MAIIGDIYPIFRQTHMQLQEWIVWMRRVQFNVSRDRTSPAWTVPTQRQGSRCLSRHSAISTYFEVSSIALCVESAPAKELNPWLFGLKRILQGGVWKFSGYTQIPWLKYVEICWNMLKYVEICWNMLKYVEICWNMLKYVEICWNMLKYVEICWNMLKYVEICWNALSPVSLSKWPSGVYHLRHLPAFDQCPRIQSTSREGVGSVACCCWHKPRGSHNAPGKREQSWTRRSNSRQGEW